MHQHTDIPRRPGRYVAVGERTHPARFELGDAHALMLAPSDQPPPPRFVRGEDPRYWVCPVPWDFVERIFEVHVWWRLHGYPVLEVEREGTGVRVRTADGSPLRRRAWRIPRVLRRDRTADGSETWVEESLLTDRREVETVLDLAQYDNPVFGGLSLKAPRTSWLTTGPLRWVFLPVRAVFRAIVLVLRLLWELLKLLAGIIGALP